MRWAPPMVSHKKASLQRIPFLENIRNQIKKERINVSSITNKKAKDILKKLGYNNQAQTKFKDCCDNKPLPFDNAIISTNTNLNILIE